MCHKQMMSDMTNKSPRSPYRRNRILREPIRPRLSRRVITTARVNLNSYWSRFEELSNQNVPTVSLGSTASVFSTYGENEINENLANEMRELCKK